MKNDFDCKSNLMFKNDFVDSFDKCALRDVNKKEFLKRKLETLLIIRLETKWENMTRQ